MTAPASPAIASPAISLSPTLRGRSRRARFWIILVVIGLATAIGAFLLSGTERAAGPALGADNPAPTGGMAVANVLRQQGVHVVTASTLAQAAAAVRSASDSTILIYDPNAYLSAQKLRTLDNLATTTVLVRPGFTALHTLSPAVTAAGAPKSAATAPLAHCSLPAAVKAGRISPPQAVYRVLNSAYTGCFPTSDGEFALAGLDGARADGTGHAQWVIGSTSVFDNQNVLRDGNAALALNLLGSRDTLVWYLPTLADVDATGPPSLGVLTPGWVTPAVLLMIAAAISAAVWRGRRFGPLVIENLPVVVRAEETMEGRARLYQRSSARLRALDALRIGAAGRIAARLGLPHTATTTEIADAAAALTHVDAFPVRDVLLYAEPRSDTELMRLSGQLRRLEDAVAAETRGAAHPESDNRPDRSSTGE
ncbi:DUF4350 domain-containing protein [Rathayibacter soli]|uniref:DUF4350 domain-containing protein n=1 Tax=Rathayibacter soli TaxID=3144168 RepID=UPI0027E58AA1|nr:DUF4350 domain-containing protein [Glaciibacter superstes]